MVQVASGGKHTVILTSNSKLYVSGSVILGLLGIHKKQHTDYSLFQKMTSLENEVIVQVQCAEFHTLCLTNEGKVYAWGGTLNKVYRMII